MPLVAHAPGKPVVQDVQVSPSQKRIGVKSILNMRTFVKLKILDLQPISVQSCVQIPIVSFGRIWAAFGGNE